MDRRDQVAPWMGGSSGGGTLKVEVAAEAETRRLVAELLRREREETAQRAERLEALRADAEHAQQAAPGAEDAEILERLKEALRVEAAAEAEAPREQEDRARLDAAPEREGRTQRPASRPVWPRVRDRVAGGFRWINSNALVTGLFLLLVEQWIGD